jgi:hypothetical protein
MPNKLETKYLGLAESNKLLRKALAQAFPGVAFRVVGKSYAGGSSTKVEWTDGPLRSQVEAIAAPFACKGFDGMIDMGFYYRQWLTADGRIVCAGTSGTAGSMGTVEAFYEERPVGAVPVSSGIGYVFCTRRYSRAMYERALASVLRKWAGEEILDCAQAIVDGYGGPYLERSCDAYLANANARLSELVNQDLQKRTGYLAAFKREEA